MSQILPILSLIALFVVTILYFREFTLRKRESTSSEKMLEETKQKSLETLSEAVKKAQTILGTAGDEQLKIVAETRTKTTQLEAQYEQDLKGFSEQLKASLNQTLSKADATVADSEKQFAQFLTFLRTKSETSQTEGEKLAEIRINQILERLESRLTEFLVQSEQKTTTSLELELRSARQLIDTYKSQQLSLIDENIVAILERTLSMVLGKKLSLKDQVDLIYESLEKAKVEKFIV